VARSYFGTDGVRGVVGETLTAGLVERLGRAAATWKGGGRVFVGRDTRASGVELERALARGIVSGGADAVLGGVLPTPAVALLALDLGAVITASHNPPEYNGVKLFDEGGAKLPDAAEEELEALLDAPAATTPGSVEHVGNAPASYLELILDRFGADLGGLRVVLDCANGAMSDVAPEAFRRLGASVTTICADPLQPINQGCGATDLALLGRTVRGAGVDLGVAFDGDGDRMLAVDAAGTPVDGDQIVAALALHLEVELVAVTTMTNLGFHRLMEERGIRVVTTDVGDRYVLEALHREGGVLGGEQSGHVIYLDGHVAGDGLAAALLLCRALEGRTLAETVAPMQRFPQAADSVPVRSKELSPELQARIDELAGEGDGRRVLVRPSGTEPVVRVLAEASTEQEAAGLCVTIATLVRRELG
jgi:phosphoglucosamine mutase